MMILPEEGGVCVTFLDYSSARQTGEMVRGLDRSRMLGEIRATCGGSQNGPSASGAWAEPVRLRDCRGTDEEGFPDRHLFGFGDSGVSRTRSAVLRLRHADRRPGQCYDRTDCDSDGDQ